VALVERPDPRAAQDLAVVRIEVAPMCTEYKAYKEGWKTEFLGHEAAGVVESVAQPGLVKVGDRVVAMPQYPCGKCEMCLDGNYIHCEHCIDQGAITGVHWGTATYAQRMVKQDWLLIPIPDDISTEHGAMACCGLGPTFGAMQTMKVDRFDTILVTGLGPVGLGAVINGAYRGARVLAVESHPYRAKLARELGAEKVFDPRDRDVLAQVRECTGGRGVDAGIDCSGVEAAQQLMIAAARRKGRVAFVGEAGNLTIHVSNDLIRKGLTLYGQWHYNRADTPRIMDVIRGCREKLDRVITHRFPMSRVQEAFDLQLSGNCGKLLLHPWK
jgi:L-iditol 2-dehydrogenase